MEHDEGLIIQYLPIRDLIIISADVVSIAMLVPFIIP